MSYIRIGNLQNSENVLVGDFHDVAAEIGVVPDCRNENLDKIREALQSGIDENLKVAIDAKFNNCGV